MGNSTIHDDDLEQRAFERKAAELAELRADREKLRTVLDQLIGSCESVIRIGRAQMITVANLTTENVRLLIEAPRDVQILREELVPENERPKRAEAEA